MKDDKSEKMENQAAPQDWSVIPDFTWGAGEEPDGLATRRLMAFPVEKRVMREGLGEQRNKPRADAFIRDMKEYIHDLTSLFTGKRQGLCITEYPVRIYPQYQLIVQDFERTALTVHQMCYSWDYIKYTKNPRKSKNALKEISDAGLKWRLCTGSEAKKLFQSFQPGDWGSLNQESEIRGVTLSAARGSGGNPTSYYDLDSGSIAGFNGSAQHYAAEIYVAGFPKDQTILELLIANRWTPAEVEDDPMWQTLVDAFQREWVSIEHVSTKEKKVRTIRFRKDLLTQAAEQGELDFWDPDIDIPAAAGSPQLFEEAKAALLYRDTVRADILACDPKQLEDPNGGSWELWDPDLNEYDMIAIPSPVYARDPRSDIVDCGVIGIDFGTKSTVVVSMEGSDHVQPVRIGMGQVARDPRESDYENPTVIEFVNLDQFLSAYASKRGRPLTRWEDLTVSHTALEEWKSNDQSNHYFSYFGELKQWAANADYWVRIRDKANKEISLRPYAQLREEDFDPIEIYAYYIGLYINNMQTRKIYLEYLLSFPVTFSLDTRQRILNSFRKGLEKSLPEAVRSDPECFDRFSVTEGAGEPAAYALCALQEYGFTPQGDEKIYFGVFDFGGGTTDFDFGLLERAPRAKRPTRHKFMIKHFGDGGDRYLGGENLLELMAFHVFRNNQDILRRGGEDNTDSRVSIPFTKPHQEELFIGYENLISDSQEARTNTRRMMEELRPLWEHTEEYEKKYTSGLLNVRLFTSNGGETTVELKLDKQALEELLHKRIRKGIDEFFSALRSVFRNGLFQDEEQKQIHIFLAGNASKSDILREEFDKAIGELTEEIHEKYREKREDQDNREYFLLYPPLGTPEAFKKMRDLGSECTEFGLDRPTGKTGVAFGLILSRKGSNYRVEGEKRQDEEIKFQFYIGIEDMDEDGYFEPLIGPDSPYGKWIEYYDAGESTFEFHYTTAPSASRRGGLLMSETKITRKTIPSNAVSENWTIYLRPVGPNEIEYVVAKDEESARGGQYEYGPERIKLEK